MSLSRTKAKSSHQDGRVNRSFRIGGSLAEENDVRNFNKSRNNKSIGPSQPHRIQLPLFFNTPARFMEEKSVSNKNKEEGSFANDKVDNGVHITVMRRLRDY